MMDRSRDDRWPKIHVSTTLRVIAKRLRVHVCTNRLAYTSHVRMTVDDGMVARTL
jgi:hypothetical protein